LGVLQVNLSPNVPLIKRFWRYFFDVATRQFYQDGLADGADDFSLAFAIGYECKSIHGYAIIWVLKDIGKSNASSFQFIENRNKSSVICFILSYSFHQ
jgi:hypothetical protein